MGAMERQSRNEEKGHNWQLNAYFDYINNIKVFFCLYMNKFLSSNYVFYHHFECG